ncbi:ELMO/CED-12 family-domain-containing protein [Pelagophyceae sp. CCMP2097]|nr:ELMO/CED-12 family-domain-containing protein [Pelagophyceae sp. CCMP2097]
MGLLDAMDAAIEETEAAIQAEQCLAPPPRAASAAPVSSAAPAQTWGSMSAALESADESDESDDDDADDADDEVEYEGPEEDRPPARRPARRPTKEAAEVPKAAAPAAREAPPSDDFFGITFQAKKKEDVVGYELPSGPAFADEWQFEKDLEESEFSSANASRLTSRAAAAAADDEFDFGDDASAGAAGPRHDGAAALAAARVRAAAAAREQVADFARRAAAAQAAAREAAASAVASDGAVDLRLDTTRALARQLDVYRPPEPREHASIRAGLGIAGITEEDEGITEEDEDDDAPRLDDDDAPRPAEEVAPTTGWEDFTEAAPESAAAPRVSERAVEADLTHAAALAYFRGLDLSMHAAAIVPTQFKKSALAALTRASLKFDGAKGERDLVFLIAEVAYDPREDEHWRTMATIYAKLINSGDRPRIIGGHWEAIGFQGSDPRTDLNRSMGMLSLLQILSLLDADLALSRRLLKCAKDYDWPFACTSIQFTKDALHALRSGKLFKACNAHKAVMPALDEFHRARFAEFERRVLGGEDRFVALNEMRTGSKVSLPGKRPAFVSRGQSSAPREDAFDCIPEASDPRRGSPDAGTPKGLAKYADA